VIFKRLQTFISVVNKGSISEAARHLHIAQPALSRHISDLEREFGLKLFDRVGRRLLLTGEGAQLVENCRSLLDHLSMLGEQAQQLRSGDQGVLTVAASPVQIETVLSTIVGRYRKCYPNVDLKLIESVGDRTLDMLARGEIQIGLAVSKTEQIEERGLGSYATPPFQLMAAWHPGVQLGHDATVEVDRLLQHPLLLLDSGFFARKTFDAACSLAGVKPNILFESQSPHALLALAEAEYGVAILSSIAGARRYKLCTSRITFQRKPLVIPLAIVWNKRRVMPRFATDFCDLLREHMHKMSPHRHFPGAVQEQAPKGRRGAAVEGEAGDATGIIRSRAPGRQRAAARTKSTQRRS
jgi:DNA-binding transcriptional LysR family regulator